MPTLKNLQFSGRVGPVIFYFIGDKFYMRSAPVKVRQTVKTKKRSTNFGIASRAGKVLRAALLPILPFPKDKLMQSRFSGAIAKWLGLQALENLQPGQDVCLYSFPFSPPNGFPEVFRVAYSISKTSNDAIEIHIPAFRPMQEIKGPPGTVSIDCTFAVAGCMLHNGIAAGSYITTLGIPYNNQEIPSQTITLPVLQKPGSLIVVAGALVFNVKKNGQVEKYSKASRMPCSVIKTYYI